MLFHHTLKIPLFQPLTFFRFAYGIGKRQANFEKREERQRGSTKETLNAISFNNQQKITIEQTNKYFQGVRMNTKYEKFYNEDKFANALTFTGRNISDLPFKCTQDQPQTKTLKASQLALHILNKVDRAKVLASIKDLSAKYFSDLINKQRTVSIQPNFQREARRTIASLMKDGYTFKLGELNKKSQIYILEVQLFKGIEVTRNNNYSIDSYEIIKENSYTYYKLWQKGSYKIPQTQWFSQFNIIMRITTLVESPYNIQITKPNTQTLKTKKRYHTIVFEMDLRKPPRFSSYRLTPQQHLRAYEPNLSNLTITNVDQRNQYAAFTYQEVDKKQKLINKLV